MTPGAEHASGGHRDSVVGRRLPWTGDNYPPLRSLQWQVHAYGGLQATDIPDLGVPVHIFPEAPDTFLRPNHLYLIRPDGFVAATAPPADAVQQFPPLMTG